MSADNFLNFNEEEDYSDKVELCRQAYKDGDLTRLDFSEEEFDYLLGFFADEYNDELVLMLSRIAYQRHPYSSDLTVRYSDALIVNREPEKAVEILEKQLGFDSSNSDVYFLLGRSQLKMGNNELARDYITHAMTLSPEEQEEMLYTAALDYIDAGNYEFALEYLEKINKDNPENIAVFNDIAFCLERTKKYDESIEFYEKYLDKEPFNDNVWFNVGTIYATLEKYDKAIEAFNYSLALNPSNSSVMYNKAIVHINTEQYDKAVQTLKEFIELEPYDPFAITALADSCLKIGLPEESEKYVKMALELDAESPDANTYMAYLMMLKGYYNEALVFLRKVIKDNSINFNLIAEDLLKSYRTSELPEFLVYYIVSMYYTEDNEGLTSGYEELLKQDIVWQDMLHNLLPDTSINKQ
ncbi:MAG: tetratricopeptide repeat protein [Bacteroidales bacterium]|nr:tetratricopeptide repeat protein [Bacteroidales bacterium]